jgi:hypothetical protein
MIELYNFLSGKNLCNVVANITVRKIEELFPNAETEISVINVGNFFIVRGHTSSDKVINISESVGSVLKKYNEKLSDNIKVIDTILYNFSFKKKPIDIFYKTSKKVNKLNYLLNKISSENIFTDLKIDEINNVIFFDPKGNDNVLVESELTKVFKNYKLIQTNFLNETFISDRFFGLSNNDEKYYYLLLMNICHHLFCLSISDDIKISINSTQIYEPDNNLNVNLDLKNSKLIVKKDWLESLVLDVFPFDLDELKNHFEINLNDEFDFLTIPEHQAKWMNTKFVKDIILV